MPATSTDFTVAAARYEGDWDEGGTVAVYLPDDIAAALLARQGWTVEPVRGGNAYVLPGRTLRRNGGAFGTDYLWERDEAVRLAITAEALR